MKRYNNNTVVAAIVAVAVVVGVVVAVGVVRAKKNYYTEAKTGDKFAETLKQKRHSVVLFYDYKNMKKDEYKNLQQIYNKVANTERYEDKENLQFLAVDVSTKEGRKIFVNYNELNDDTMVELPAILLFRDGKMIDNQLGGAVTKERIKSFIERYFKRDPKSKKKYRMKQQAQKKKARKTSAY